MCVRSAEGVSVFGWFRKYVRKIGVFGIEVEFHPPTEAAHSPAPPPLARDNSAPVAVNAISAEADKRLLPAG